MKCILVDIDGVLSNHSHRVQHAYEKNWPMYHYWLSIDPPVTPIIELVNTLHEFAKIIIITGRPFQYMQQTLDWLEHNKVYHDGLFMRKDSDHRPSAVVKQEIMETLLAQDLALKIWFAIDDQSSVKEMYNKCGIMCLQPHEIVLSPDVPLETVAKKGFSSPAEILHHAAETWEAKHLEYKEAYKQHGEILKAMFPEGLTLHTVEDFTRMGLLNACVVKLNRYGNNFPANAHLDSIHDLSIYAAMLEHVDRLRKQL